MNQETLQNSSFYLKMTRITKKILQLKPENPHLFLFESVSIMPEKLELEEEDTIDPDKLVSLSIFHIIQSSVFRSVDVQQKLNQDIYQLLLSDDQAQVNCIRMKFIIKIYFDVKKIIKYLDDEFDSMYEKIFALEPPKSKETAEKPKKKKTKPRPRDSFSHAEFLIIIERVIFFAEFFIALEDVYALKLDVDFLEFVRVLLEYLANLTQNSRLLHLLQQVDFRDEIETNYSVKNIEKKSLFKLLCHKMVSFFEPNKF